MQQGESLFSKICDDYYVIKQCKICFYTLWDRRKLQNDYLQTTENHSCKSIKLFHMIFQTFKIFLEVFLRLKKSPAKDFVSLKRQIQEDERRKIEFRKPMYPVNPELMDYLEKIIDLPISDFIMMIYYVFRLYACS